MKTLKKYIELAIKEVEQSIRHGYHNELLVFSQTNIVKHLEDIMSPKYSENEILINCINAQFSWGAFRTNNFP